MRREMSGEVNRYRHRYRSRYRWFRCQSEQFGYTPHVCRYYSLTYIPKYGSPGPEPSRTTAIPTRTTAWPRLVRRPRRAQRYRTTYPSYVLPRALSLPSR